MSAARRAAMSSSLRCYTPPVHVLLGNIALMKRDGQAAIREFQEYLKLDPKSPMAQGVEAMLKRIQQAQNRPQ